MRRISLYLSALFFVFCGSAHAEDEGIVDSILGLPSSIASYIYDKLVEWVSDLLEGLRAWIVQMFQDVLDETLDLIIKLLPTEVSETEFTLPDGMLDVMGFVSVIFPVSYAASLVTAYSTFHLSFWIYRKCLGFFGLVKPKFT